MNCPGCGSKATTERPERTAQGYRRFRCRACRRQFNERTGSVLNRAQYPSDVTSDYPYLGTRLASVKPSSMSVSRDSPRHITMFPGGGSLLRAR